MVFNPVIMSLMFMCMVSAYIVVGAYRTRCQALEFLSHFFPPLFVCCVHLSCFLVSVVVLLPCWCRTCFFNPRACRSIVQVCRNSF